jgi:hypothetical protein
MDGVIRGPIGATHLHAIASDLFAILAVNGLYRPVKSADAVRFYQLGPEPPRRMQWWTMEEYTQLMNRRERRGSRRRPELRLVVGERSARKPSASR